jgi:hypothetical protein
MSDNLGPPTRGLLPVGTRYQLRRGSETVFQVVGHHHDAMVVQVVGGTGRIRVAADVADTTARYPLLEGGDPNVG